MRIVRLLPSPAGLFRSSRPVGTEVSRFSCMLFLSVRRFSDYAGSTGHSRSNAASHVAFPYHRRGSAPCSSVFRSSIARPTDTPIYASTGTSRCQPQDSGPRWIRFLLSCTTLSFATTCRFNPAHPGKRRSRPMAMVTATISSLTRQALLRSSVAQPLTNLVPRPTSKWTPMINRSCSVEGSASRSSGVAEIPPLLAGEPPESLGQGRQAICSVAAGNCQGRSESGAPWSIIAPPLIGPNHIKPF
jgi:hypothetical protein